MPSSTQTSRYAWAEAILADVTKVRASHINELREAADDLDERLDYHVGFGGTDRHPIVTNTVAGFMSPEQKQQLDALVDKLGPGGTYIYEYVDMVKDSYALRTGRYSFSTSQGQYQHVIDMGSWAAEWDKNWTAKYPGKPNPGFQCVVIPAITGIRTGKSATWYDYLVEKVDSIERLDDVRFKIQVSVSGSDASGHIDTYGCQGWTNFTFTVLGASKNMFRDDGSLAGGL